MATIDLTTWLTSFTTASYDDTTGNITLSGSIGLTSDESIIVELIETIISSASGKRTNLNSPIGEGSFTQNASLLTRTNADNSASELQVEKPQSLSLFFVAPDLTSLNPVNDND